MSVSWNDGLDLPDVPVTVCIAHGRFVPCRRGRDGDECVTSSAPGAVAWVRERQSGDADWRDADEDYAIRTRAGSEGTWLVIECSVHGGVAAAVSWDAADAVNWIEDHRARRHADVDSNTSSESGSQAVPSRPPLPASRFLVDAFETVVLRCTVCGGLSPGMGGSEVVLLSDLTGWAQAHRCPGQRVT